MHSQLPIPLSDLPLWIPGLIVFLLTSGSVLSGRTLSRKRWNYTWIYRDEQPWHFWSDVAAGYMVSTIFLAVYVYTHPCLFNSC